MNEYFDNWEEVPGEDLYEDGELNSREVALKIMANLHLGRYKLIRHRVRIHE